MVQLLEPGSVQSGLLMDDGDAIAGGLRLSRGNRIEAGVMTEVWWDRIYELVRSDSTATGWVQLTEVLPLAA
jgi:hypothetical protein